MRERWRSLIPLGSLLLGLGAEIAAYRALPSTRFLEFPWTLAGALPLAAGLGLILYSITLFVRRRTTLEPAGTPSALIREGPYRFTRNPIYLGDILVLAGVGVLAPSAATFVVPPLFFIVVDRLVVPFEEARLAGQFGAAYEDYRRAVPRWL